MTNDRLHENLKDSAPEPEPGYAFTDCDHTYSDHTYNEDAHAPDETEIRYALTALGTRALDEGRGFSGFGPCGGAAWRSETPANVRPRRGPRSRRQRAMPLFD